MAVVSVVATVNGAEQVMTLTEDSTYEVDAVSSTQDSTILVTATDENGNTKTASEELYIGYEWLPPKIEWSSEDAFDYVAYNRVSSNLMFLRSFARSLFANLTELSLETEKTNLSLIYARHMNAIEDGLELLNAGTYGKEIGEKKTYKPNGNVPTYEEYNRIERACLVLYNELTVHKANLPRLAFTLGNKKGIRV